MRYGSVCSGIEAATVAWHPLGWEPAFFSEIDNFPRAVLQHHYPSVPLHGDFTTIGKDAYDPIDLLAGGTPCQAFSVAGLRKGLADERGNLTLEFVRLAQRLRPRWLVWENVPGVLSIDRGRAFGSFLGGLAELGYGFAYRVLDAQHFGVPQRRRRVFVVGYLGDWRPAAAVLFESESLLRDITPRRKTREGVATCPTLRAGGNRSGGDRPPGTDVDTAESLIASPLCARSQSRGVDSDCTATLITHSLRADGFDASEDGTGRGTPLVPVPYRTNAAGQVDPPGETVASLTTMTDPSSQFIAFSCKDHGADAGDTAPTLRAMGHGGSHANAGGQIAVAQPYTLAIRGRDEESRFEYRQDGLANAILTPNGGRAGIGVGAVAIPIHDKATRHKGGGRTGDDGSSNGLGIGQPGDPMPTLDTGCNHAVAFQQNTRDELRYIGGDGAIAGALAAEPGMKQQNFIQELMSVRRLTPRECERLQGFPDDFTLVPYRGKPAADGPRYKALGNSMAVPVMHWLGQRIQMVDDLQAEMAA